MATSGVASSSGSSGRWRRTGLALVALGLVWAAGDARAQNPGDVVISEIMIAPPATSSTREWFELYGVNAVDLQGCTLREGPSADPFDAGTDWHDHVVDAPLVVPAGQHVLLAKSHDCVVGDGAGGCAVPADHEFGTLSFNNDTLEWLYVICGNTVIDAAPYDWREFEDGCPQKGCSVNLGDEFYDSNDNDDLDHWCLPPPDATFLNAADDPCTGTPDAMGECLTYDWPAGGELCFTELMIAPAETPEWFEIVNLTDRDLELQLCTLRKFKRDENGDQDPGSVREYTFGAEGDPVPLGAHELQVWSYKECITPGVAGDDDSAEDGGCEYGERIYDTISFTNSAEELLEITCPDGQGNEIVVDRIIYDMEREGIRDGHSRIFFPEGDDPAGDNDNVERWCEAAFSQCYLTVTPEDCNYGTPGSADECVSDEIDWPDNGPACRCRLDARAAAPGAGLALLAALGLWAARRRRDGRGDGR